MIVFLRRTPPPLIFFARPSIHIYVHDDLVRYLLIPNVLSAAVSHGCTMMHPGYGFLAENAGFVDMCKEHRINFIGPNVSISHQIKPLSRIYFLHLAHCV